MAKGHKTGGRAKGTPNKINGQVREMILAALDGVGGVDYLAMVAIQNPPAFFQLLAKVLPLQIGGGSPVVSPIVKRVIIDPQDPGRQHDL